MKERKSTIERLKSEQFDVLIIGSGINGAAAAWDASLRGLKVGLIDKGDFGAATSAGCFKIVHGGLRYLQHLDFKRLQESVEEQRLLRIIAPHLLTPLAFLIPCYKPLMKRRFMIRLALGVYEFLARNRNKDVQSGLELLNHQVLSTGECLDLAPGLETKGLEGGVLYYDVQMNNCERLTFEVAAAADSANAAVANYLEVSELVCDMDGLKPVNPESPRRITAARVEDKKTGETFDIKASAFVNAAGPWIEQLAEQSGFSNCANKIFSKGIQLIVPPLGSRCAFAVEGAATDAAARLARGGRSYFIQPWNGYSLIGTSDELVEQHPDSYRITQRDIERFLSEVKSAYNAPELCLENVLGVFGGLRPVADDVNIHQEGDQARVARKDLIIDHEKTSFGDYRFSNLISMRGVKYTTFRLFAQRTVDLLLEKLSVSRAGSKTSRTKLPMAPDLPISKYLQQLQERFKTQSAEYLLYLIRNYGTAAEEICSLYEQGYNDSIPVQAPVTSAELVYALRNESVQQLDDLLCRRVPVCLAGIVAPEVLEYCLELAAKELEWSQSDIDTQRQIFLQQQAKSRGVEFDQSLGKLHSAV